MNFIRTDIPDVVIIEPKVHGDHRGYFVETYRQDTLEDFLGFKVNFCQDNESKSSRGVLRGLHYQLHPAAQTKLVRVIQGRVLDVAVNHRAVETLAHIAKAKGIPLIHISTDYVFDGGNFKPYTENDPTNPQGVYGQSKLAGEEAMMAINPPGGIIIRTSWVYSSFGNNFVKTMLRLGKERDELGVICDQIGTPTYARDLAETIFEILRNPKPRTPNSVVIYHYSNEGAASWYDFAKAIFELSDIDCNVKPIETKEYPTPARRPHYSLLNKAKIKKEFGIVVPYWRDSLSLCLMKLGEKRS